MEIRSGEWRNRPLAENDLFPAMRGVPTEAAQCSGAEGVARMVRRLQRKGPARRSQRVGRGKGATKKRTVPTNFAASPLPMTDRSPVPRPATDTGPRSVPCAIWIKRTTPQSLSRPYNRARWGALPPLGSSGLYEHNTRTLTACQEFRGRSFCPSWMDIEQPEVCRGRNSCPRVR